MQRHNAPSPTTHMEVDDVEVEEAVAVMEAKAMEAAAMEGVETIISSSSKEATGVVCDR